MFFDTEVRTASRLALGVILVLTALSAPAGAEIKLQLDHARTDLSGIADVRLDGDLLRFKGLSDARSLIVVRSDMPLSVGTTENCRASLRPGWDGTLGYSLYGLQVETELPGQAAIELWSLGSPSSPVETAPNETARFMGSLASRPSRFPVDAAGFTAWRQRYRRDLAEWLMGGGLPERVAVEPEIISNEDYGRFTLERVRYRTRPNRANTLLLALPKVGARVPLLLALHGHEATWGEADAGAFREGHNDDFCAYFAERGWAVLQPATMNHTLQHERWTLQGEWTWDAIAALDYAASVPQVDMERVAVCGLSTGGHLAMNVLALDDRVKGGVVAGVLSTWNHYSKRLRIPPGCDCGISAQLGARLAQCDWAALAAPKPVQFQHGRKDAVLGPGADPSGLQLKWGTGVLPQAEYDAAFAEVRRAYRLTGEPKAVETYYHPDGHGADNEAAFEWLTRLLGVRTTRP